MGSKKRSARDKELAAFRESLVEEAARNDANSFDAVFAREKARLHDDRENREAAQIRKSCTSKNRYASAAEANAAIAACAEAGRTGLSCYRCKHCKGWHLTSHPWEPAKT